MPAMEDPVSLRPALVALFFVVIPIVASADGDTLLLRQPSVGAEHIVFTHGADVWIVDRDGGLARRITATPAIESHPHLSPDGQWIAFASNRTGPPAVYVVGVDGGEARRLSWYPSTSSPRGWTRDGERVLYMSTRGTAPRGFGRLWTVDRDGGPSTLVPAPWAYDGSFAPDGERIAIDRMTRWDSEWQDYRGGQNTPLLVMDLESLDEVRIPNDERTTDVQPVWVDGTVYFRSDRDGTMNVWAYDVASASLRQVTDVRGSDVKWLAGGPHGFVIERDGALHELDVATGATERIEIDVRGDFPWAATQWEDVSDDVDDARISPTGQRAVMQARGEIFTVPVEHGDARNLTASSDAHDRTPLWSPDGATIAWFSDDGDGYELRLTGQDGLGDVRTIGLGESKMAWEATWSPDGAHIAFVDDDARVRVIDVERGRVETVDVGGTNLEIRRMGLTWSPDSGWLAYAKTFDNMFRRIVAWSVEDDETVVLTDPLADSMAPAFDRDGRHLYFLASTDLALGSGWANTSAMTADPTYAPWVMILRADDPTPFPLRSDEEEVEDESADDEAADEDEADAEDEDDAVRIDADGIERRIIALPMPAARYRTAVAGPEGTVFFGKSVEDAPGMTLEKFSLEDREAETFVEGIRSVDVSADGEKMLLGARGSWRVVGTGSTPQPGDGALSIDLRVRLDRRAEWKQIFDEAWRYERDFFYDPGLHGADWNAVRARYRPLVEHVRHRADLTYVLDQVNGELAVGHSFVGGGDLPDTDAQTVGLLGADLTVDDGAWRIERIYTMESWNPGLSAPLDAPGLRAEEGHWLVGVNGTELTGDDDPYGFLDGTIGRQTVLHLNDRPTMDDAWTVTVEPIRSEGALRRRAWVEDNRRRVDELSDGRLAYVWIPNTSGQGAMSFDRYFFAQQDREGAVIDERFNGGGLLDDYMVDYMTRSLRAAVTNEAEGGRPFVLPQGILGPKVLLINELAGSGGDYFPWAFRQQQVGPLIGMRTWGGLVKSSVHYAMVDGGFLTAPDNAVFDPRAGEYIGENVGIPPDIEVWNDAKSVAAGRDPQLERAVREALRLLEDEERIEVERPPYPRPAQD